jgi:Fusaric acid resistance protein-like
MKFSWYRDLFAIGTVTGVKTVALRMSLAVGAPLIGGVMLGHPAAGVAGGATALFVTMSDIGTTRRVRLGTMLAGWLAIVLGGTLGHQLAGLPHGNELVILGSALVAGWASGSQPGIAAVTRFFAIAAAAGQGMHFPGPDVLPALGAGGTSAFVAAYLAWKWSGIPVADNVIDWRSGVRRAFAGVDAGPRYTLCYATAAAVALYAASTLHVADPFWATLVVLMVMRREGVASLELTVQYALGTFAGVLVAALILHWLEQPLALAVLATLVAAAARIGFALNPALGFMSFTMFLLFVVHVVMASNGLEPQHLLATRIYDVAVGCVLALAGTLAATYPRLPATEA